MGSFFKSLADAELAKSLSALDPLLKFYDPEVKAQVAREADGVRHFAAKLDRRLDEIVTLCVRATEAKQIGEMLARLRGDTLRFLHSQAVAIQLLNLHVEIEQTKSRQQGLEGAARQLVIKRCTLRIEDAAHSIKPLLEAQTSSLRELPGSVWELFVRAPHEKRSAVEIWSAVGLDYAKASQHYFSVAIKGTRQAIWSQLGKTVWAEIQQHWGFVFSLDIALVFAVVGWLLGKPFPALSVAIVVGLVAWWLCPRLERAFKKRHLPWYGRLCTHAAVDLYASQVLAAAAVVGLEEIAKAGPMTNTAVTP